MKLMTMTQVTVDGVMQGNGPVHVDHENGFERGGRAMGAGDAQTRALITRTCQRADAFLSGGRTYELFASSGEAAGHMRAHPILRGHEPDARVRRVGHAHRAALGGHGRLDR